MPTATTTIPDAKAKSPEAFMGFQDRYVTRTAIVLTLYAMLFFVLAFLSPYLAPALTLFGEASVQERKLAADQLLFLNETVWTALPVFFFGSLLFGLLLTKRVAGPLAHLERCAVQWGKGYVAQRVAFLPADRLDGLETTTNAAWAQVERTLDTIDRHNHDLRRIADSLALALVGHSSGPPELAERASQIVSASGAIKTALQPFRLIPKP